MQTRERWPRSAAPKTLKPEVASTPSAASPDFSRDLLVATVETDKSPPRTLSARNSAGPEASGQLCALIQYRDGTKLRQEISLPINLSYRSVCKAVSGATTIRPQGFPCGLPAKLPNAHRVLRAISYMLPALAPKLAAAFAANPVQTQKKVTWRPVWRPIAWYRAPPG